MTRSRVYVGLAVTVAFAAGAVAAHLAAPKPQSFAECLLVNAREARAADAVHAIAEACESLYPSTSNSPGAVADLARREESQSGSR